jgi:HAD superfamily hydrolase (TIGR01662 family)
LLTALDRCTDGPLPEKIVVVDDRPFDARVPLELQPKPLDLDRVGVSGHRLRWPVEVVRTGGRGPAAARNAGWRSTSSPWIAFLDDDVEVDSDWMHRLTVDLAATADDVAGVQAQLIVPLPAGRRPTDWERNTAGLQDAAWITADMAYRRTALEQVSGLDERFPRAYREDADLALRVRRAGWRLERGARVVTHPVRPADDWVSVRTQAGAADDALLRALHGRDWRAAAQTGRGRFRWHVATVATGGAAAAALLTGRRRTAAVLAAGSAALTADFARRRLTPGPRLRDDAGPAELRRMVATSAVIPFAAVLHRIRGLRRHGLSAPAWPVPITAVLFDRDGTLVHDVPYNGDPDLVRPVEGARELLDELRAAGVRVGVVSNQSGIGRGLLSNAQAAAVNARIDRELGPFGTWQICPHVADDRCVCRKPLPGMVMAAARELGVAPYECAVIGDIEADVLAARAAGATGVLVPTPVTRADEIDRADLVATDLRAAVTAALASRRRTPAGTTVAPAAEAA